jgi:type II secretory ATPase GspE/PulE/Tfp pilus assembly ATPase PilB-like protein
MTLSSPANAHCVDVAPVLKVTFGLLNGDTVEGLLHEFGPEKAELLLDAGTAKAQTIAVRRIAYIGFQRTAHGADLPGGGTESYKVHLVGGAVFEVSLVPGSWRNGAGFYATPRDPGPYAELFFYNHGVRAHEKDLPLGAMLVRLGALHPDALDHAVIAQHSGRSTPIGQILVEKLKVTEEDVARAIALQHERKQRIGEVLTEEGLATREDIEAALLEQRRRKGKRLGEVLVDMHIVTEQTLAKTLAKKFDLPFVTFSDYPPDASLAAEIPPHVAQKHGILPLERRGETLVVAISDPLALDTTALTELHPNRTIELVMTTPSALKERLDDWLGNSPRVPTSAGGAELEMLLKRLADEHETDLPRIESAREASVEELLEQLVLEAVRAGATHIHVESEASARGVVRFRTSAGCQIVNALPETSLLAFIRHVQAQAHLDASERDVPQQGAFSLTTRHGMHELSVSLIPVAPSGVDLVLAFTQSSRPRLSISELGFTPGTLRAFQRLIEQPAGLVLFVGPLGSGRTTAMHAALAALDNSRLKIWAADDEPPLNLELGPTSASRIRQLQVKPQFGFGFSSALRCLLRADADVILIGELDDPETARVALDGVHAGRRVFSALNAHWAVQGLSRLLDMPLDSHAIGGSLRGVLAQRLVRRLCSECRQSSAATLSERDELARACRSVQIDSLLNWIFEPDLVFWHSRGCKACNGSGYSGKMALHELLIIDGELSHAIANRAPSAQLREIAQRSGMTTLLQDGIAKALAGFTDLKQVLAAVHAQ